MEIIDIPDCDFGMIRNLEVYAVDNDITDASQFILQNPSDPSAPHNAVKVGEFLNIPDGIGHTIFLDPNENAIMDQFIHAGDFKTYAFLVFDKAFTEESALIQSKMTFSVTLINEN